MCPLKLNFSPASVWSAIFYVKAYLIGVDAPTISAQSHPLSETKYFWYIVLISRLSRGGKEGGGSGAGGVRQRWGCGGADGAVGG